MTQTGLAIRVADNYSPSAGMTQSRFNAFSLSLARARHRGLATLAGVLLLLVVAGCGGSGQLSKADYQTRLQKDAKSLADALKPLASTAKSPLEQAPKLSQARDKLRGAANDLGKAKPPKNVAADNAALATGLSKFADELDSFHAVALKNDQKLYNQALQQLGHSHAIVEVETAAKDLQKKGYSLVAAQ